MAFLHARHNKVKLLGAMDVFFERSSGDGHNVGEVVRPCSLCNESNMVLKRKPVIVNGNFMVGCLRFPLVSLMNAGCELPSTRSRDVTRRSSLDVKPPSSLTSVFTLLVPPQGQAKHHPLLRLLFIYICTLPCFDNKQRHLHSLFIAHEIHNSELYFRSNNSLSAQLLVAQITAASLPAVLLYQSEAGIGVLIKLCRNVVWLPGSISEASVTDQICPNCTPGPIHKVLFKFRRLEIPPNYDADHLGCIGGCDVILRELIEICGTGSRHPSGMSGQVTCDSCGKACALRTANTENGQTVWKMVAFKDVVDPVGVPAGRLPPQGEVVMPGVREVGVLAAAHLYQQLENQYRVAALYAVTLPILQMPAPTVAGNSFESSQLALSQWPHLSLLLYVFMVH
ncbi:hypothetical protein ZIOFF_051214 [Zingiber officinale]|uniref:Uncharacterized protein n=1 Tax=Zingiber officinale TaxID=94328 RepID=A0A8J5KUD0_ZINOF|nr:hypothetical protein ZIOFF_051214 [Zingiber officinale]